MKKIIRYLLPVWLILLGTGLLGYPWISQYLFDNRTDSIIHTYEAVSEETDAEEKSAMLALAQQYNSQLTQAQVTLTDPFTKQESRKDGIDYHSVLALDERGMMASIEIPKISVNLPVYHGTSGDVLESGIGHLEGSSLPIGGTGTHAVLSGHTGLNTAKMFTDLTELTQGDLFFIHVLGDTLAYEVCEIHIVVPEDTSRLLIQDGSDLVTLVTCTPYGVNTHRLLVTGKRTEYTEEIHEETVKKGSREAGSLWMQSYKKAILIGLGIVFFFVCCLYLSDRIRRH